MERDDERGSSRLFVEEEGGGVDGEERVFFECESLAAVVAAIEIGTTTDGTTTGMGVVALVGDGGGVLRSESPLTASRKRRDELLAPTIDVARERSLAMSSTVNSNCNGTR